MYQVRVAATGEVVFTCETLKQANLFIFENWNMGPLIVLEALTEEIVARPKLLNE